MENITQKIIRISKKKAKSGKISKKLVIVRRLSIKEKLNQHFWQIINILLVLTLGGNILKTLV